VTSVLLLLLASALVATTSLLVSARLTRGSATAWLVGAYVIGFAEIVVVSVVLSLWSELDRPFLLGTLFGLLCVSLLTIRGSSFPPIRDRARLFLVALRDPPVTVLAIVVLGVLAYSVALGLFLPSNDIDALQYHLARAAFWKQGERLGYIPGAGDARLDGLPPNGELPMAFTMIISGTGRFASLVQLAAALAAAMSIYGMSRWIGVDVRRALMASLLFLTLPAVAMQASTSLNDVIVASLVCASAFFLLRTDVSGLALAGLAVALLVGTKLTGILALPGLALIGLVSWRRRKWLPLGVLSASALVGGYWYWFNYVRVGDLFGASGISGAGVSAEGVNADPLAALARIIRLSLAPIELTGAVGWDRLLYVIAAVVVACIMLTTPDGRRMRRKRAGLAALVTLLPLALVPAGQALVRASLKLYFELGRGDIGYLDPHRDVTKASPTYSWYGPLGFLLTLLSCVFVVRAVRRRQLPIVSLVLVAAPVLWIIFLGIAVPYWEWNGRYAMGGFALGAATWGVVLRVRSLAWATTALATLTALLAFVHMHDRAAGIRVFAKASEASVWSQPDWTVQATDHPEVRAILRFTALKVPRDAVIAVAPIVWPPDSELSGGMPIYPFFGPDLTRKVHLADSPKTATEEHAGWAVLRASEPEACVKGWAVAFSHAPWVVLRRAPGRLCA
jgi:hypothetical protein